MSRHAVRIARIRQVDVRVDPSLLVLALLFAWVFSQRFLAVHPTAVAWTMSAAGVVLLLASILAHELAHALEAQRRGIEVEGITLLMFGGVTEMHAHSRSPRDEFVIAAVGPYVSLLCGAVFGLVATYLPDLIGGTTGAAVGDVAGMLGWLNVALAVFNLVPGAPLDGGRVLRALVWWLSGNRRTGLRVAGRVGQGLGLALAGVGVWVFTQVPEAGIVAFWAVIVGAFLWSAARTELRQSDADDLLDRHTVRDVVGPLPAPVPADQRLDLLDVDAAGLTTALLPVVASGEVVGVLDVEELRDLHPTDRSVRTADELMRPLDGEPRVGLDAGLRELVEAFAGARGLVRIDEGGHTVAAVTEGEVARALRELRTGRGRAGRRNPANVVGDGTR